MGGYVNLGDCIVLLSGWILGPVYGSVASGIGVMAADIFAGFIAYAPASLIIKAAMAFSCCVVFRKLNTMTGRRVLSLIVSGLVGEVIMILGYFAYASIILGNGLAAAAAIPADMIQGGVGLVCGIAVYEMLMRNSKVKAIVESIWSEEE